MKNNRTGSIPLATAPAARKNTTEGSLMNKAVRAMPAIVVAAGIACAPPAQAGTGADTSNLDQIVAGVYNKVQRGCTPQTPPSLQRIQWDAGSPTGGGGTGRIIDANPNLGGPFQVLWNLGPNAPSGYRSVPAQPQGYWDIELEFC